MSGVEGAACCVCQKQDRPVRNLIMLNVRGPVPGKGWGCVQCHTPSDGATATLCDTCLPRWQADERVMRFACVGYPGDGVLVELSTLTEAFGHNMALHPEEQQAVH